MRMTALRRLWLTVPVAVLALSACGQTPESTENARGVLRGIPIVIAMSALFIVAAVAIIGAAIAVDRMIRSRAALAQREEVPEEEEEPEDEIVAGIPVGRASVPRWLYAAYVLIPIFAFAYVFSNVAVAPAQPEATPEPTPSGPCTDCQIAAQGIQFTSDSMQVAAGTEVTVAFENQDAGVPHDWSVFESEADAPADPVAKTPTFPGVATREVSFESPEAGTEWYFLCTVHPAMNGTLEAVEA